eukprot:9669939-Heterocapsa_arctica.AAC.1
MEGERQRFEHSPDIVHPDGRFSTWLPELLGSRLGPGRLGLRPGCAVRDFAWRPLYLTVIARMPEDRSNT